MPILKPMKSHAGGAPRPYPSWDVVADTVGLQQKCAAQDQQARKEALLWRELADETSTETDRVASRR